MLYCVVIQQFDTFFPYPALRLLSISWQNDNKNKKTKKCKVTNFWNKSKTDSPVSATEEEENVQSWKKKEWYCKME